MFLDYALPSELIAQTPVEPRDGSRLLVVDRFTGELHDRRFFDLPEMLQPGDLLVLNDTKVVPARIIARRSTGGKVEILLLEPIDRGTWKALVSPLRRLRPGELLQVGDVSDTGDRIEFMGRDDAIGIVRLEDSGLIARHGSVPLPPYIHQTIADPDRYQTVYADNSGSAAAPTAGLHFTSETIERCRDRGIEFATVTLHVGTDTFRPLASDSFDDHVMHSERFSVSDACVKLIAECKAGGGRIIATGTTTTRVLETIGSPDGISSGGVSGRTNLFIKPPFQFKIVQGMITNFHLPNTSLLLLVGAFAGSSLLERAYLHAIQERYRFYSFGDAMLIV